MADSQKQIVLQIIDAKSQVGFDYDFYEIRLSTNA